jgi:hypothetical protein
VLGPLLLLIVHAYVLLHISLLAGKVGAFREQLEKQIASDSAKAQLRRQLPSNIFVQLLSGPDDVRMGFMGLLLRMIAGVSLVLGPLALLVSFQLQFLPYHHEAVAWWQRLTAVLDLVVLWRLWPSITRGSTTWLIQRDVRSPKVATAALASLACVVLVFAVATFPGEWLDETLPSIRFVPTNWPSGEWTSLHKLLVAGEVDPIAGKPTSLWSNRLVVSDAANTAIPPSRERQVRT